MFNNGEMDPEEHGNKTRTSTYFLSGRGAGLGISLARHGKGPTCKQKSSKKSLIFVKELSLYLLPTRFTRQI